MIIHVDMDAFYASVEQRDHPELRGKPVVVGGSKSGRGVVAAASYEARKFGIHSAMSGKQAAKLCPDAVFVKSNIRHYAEVGRQVRDIFQRYTPIIQPLSLDEAFLDVSGSLKLFGSAEKIGISIRDDIQEELRLPASVGIAPVKFAAKIASDIEKPNGFVVVTQDRLQEFLDPLPVQRLWGVGTVGFKKLEKLGIKTVQQLRMLGAKTCIDLLGNWGEHLHRLSVGSDDRRVTPDHVCKTIGHERTFHEDITDDEFLNAASSFLVEQICVRLRAAQRLAHGITMKYRLHDFRTFTRNASLKLATDSTHQFTDAALKMLAAARQQFDSPVRLIGFSLNNLTNPNAPRQLNLFDQEIAQQQTAIDRVSDQLKNKFGDAALYRATGHRWVESKREKKSDGD